LTPSLASQARLLVSENQPTMQQQTKPPSVPALRLVPVSSSEEQQAEVLENYSAQLSYRKAPEEETPSRTVSDAPTAEPLVVLDCGLESKEGSKEASVKETAQGNGYIDGLTTSSATLFTGAAPAALSNGYPAGATASAATMSMLSPRLNTRASRDLSVGTQPVRSRVPVERETTQRPSSSVKVVGPGPRTPLMSARGLPDGGQVSAMRLRVQRPSAPVPASSKSSQDQGQGTSPLRARDQSSKPSMQYPPGHENVPLTAREPMVSSSKHAPEPDPSPLRTRIQPSPAQQVRNRAIREPTAGSTTSFQIKTESPLKRSLGVVPIIRHPSAAVSPPEHWTPRMQTRSCVAAPLSARPHYQAR